MADARRYICANYSPGIVPELHLIAGPNGSGKSSFVLDVRNGERVIDYTIPGVINPDEIASSMNPANPDASALAAGREALVQRKAALANGGSFAIETTFSGNSERQLIAAAKAAGYVVTMTYIALDNPEDNVSRVDRRAAIERRTVAAEDVRRRYERSLDNVATIADELDELHVFDNSGKNFEHVLTMQRGHITTLAEVIPAWVERAFGSQLAGSVRGPDLAERRRRRVDMMNLSDRRSLEISLAVARELDRNPNAVLVKGLTNIARWRDQVGTHPHLQEWEKVIRRGPRAVRAVLTRLDHRSRQLRSSSPFAGVLSEEVRLEAIARASDVAEPAP